MQRILSNPHTHTVYCDGSNTPEELVRHAIKLGFVSLGFSGHSYHPDFGGGCMSPASTRKYIDEVNRMKVKYGDRIIVRLGIEEDVNSSDDPGLFDYMIGSVHAMPDPETARLRPFADTDALQQELIRDVFRGDPYAMAAHYFGMVAEYMTSRRPEILGHFDLITRFNYKGRVFDEDDERYMKAGLEALDAATEHGAVTEINTGTFARSVTNYYYPRRKFLEFLQEHHRPVIVSSDCHEMIRMNIMFDAVSIELKEIGFREVLILGRNGFDAVPLGD